MNNKRFISSKHVFDLLIHDLIKPRKFNCVTAVSRGISSALPRRPAEFTKFAAEFVKFYRGKLWALLISICIVVNLHSILCLTVIALLLDALATFIPPSALINPSYLTKTGVYIPTFPSYFYALPPEGLAGIYVLPKRRGLRP